MTSDRRARAEDANAHNGSALIVGDLSDPASLDVAARGAATVLSYSFEQAVRLRETTGREPQLIDIAEHSAEAQATAWEWTTAYEDFLCRRVRGLSAGALEASRRRLFLEVFWPIAAASAKADVVRSLLGEAPGAKVLGVSGVEQIALAARGIGSFPAPGPVRRSGVTFAATREADTAWRRERRAADTRSPRERLRDLVVTAVGEERLWRLLLSARNLTRRLMGRPRLDLRYEPTEAEGARRQARQHERTPETEAVRAYLRGPLRTWLDKQRDDPRRIRKLQDALRQSKAESDQPVVLALAAVPIHVELLQSTLGELRARGWRCCIEELSEIEGLGAATRPVADETVRFIDFTRAAEPQSRELEWLRLSRRVRRATSAWAGSSGLAGFADMIRTGFEMQYREARWRMDAQAELLQGLAPDLVLTVSELYPRVEAAVPVCRALGIPTVNVQHGAIKPLPINSEFRFDAFCVFGEAYEEVLASLGTPAEQIRVTGSPFTDSPAAATRSPDRPPASEPAAADAFDPQRFNILFAAGYSWDMTGDATLYRTLKMVLDHAERDPGVHVVVKLHPVGTGHEFGYETALAECRNASVTVIRGGDAQAFIERTDCVATYGSTVAFDAASSRKPTVILNPWDAPDNVPLVAEGVALRARNAGEFGECVARFRSGQAISDQTYATFERRYNYRRDGRAGHRIADVCEGLAGKTRAQAADLAPRTEEGR